MKFSSHNAATIKGLPAPKPSRAFALWLALLFLYFMLLPTAAEVQERGVEAQATQSPTVAPASRYDL